MPYLETKTYRLLTISPIHIRAGEASREYGQAFIRLGDFIYIVDTPALQRELIAFGGLDAVNACMKVFSDSEKRIVPVLDKIKYDYKTNIKKISRGVVHSPRGKRFMKSGLGQYFVPGSSIKGAIKTAVLYDMLKKDKAALHDLDPLVEKQIKAYQSAKNPKIAKRIFAQKLITDNFQSVHPEERVKNSNRKPETEGSFKDFFRAVKVKDGMIEEKSVDTKLFAKAVDFTSKGMTLENLEGTEIFIRLDDIFKNVDNLTEGSFVKIEDLEEVEGKLFAKKFTQVDEVISNKLEFCEVAVVSLNGKETYEKYRDKRIQCFKGETTIEIALDHEILKSFQRGGLTLPFSDLDSLISICQNFANDQWEAEQKYLTDDVESGNINLDSIKEFYEKRKGKAKLRVGWGTGMLGTTVDLLLDEQMRKELRNEVIADGKNYPLPAPKSRRFALENDEPVYPLGWIQLSEVKNE